MVNQNKSQNGRHQVLDDPHSGYFCESPKILQYSKTVSCFNAVRSDKSLIFELNRSLDRLFLLKMTWLKGFCALKKVTVIKFILCRFIRKFKYTFKYNLRTSHVFQLRSTQNGFPAVGV